MPTSYLDSNDDAILAKNEAAMMESLLSLGFVEVEQYDIDGRDAIVYSIATTDRKTLKS